MPNSEPVNPQDLTSTSTTPNVDITALYTVIGAKEVHICRLNAAIGEAQEEIRQLKASVSAMEREFERLRGVVDPQPTTPTGGL